MYLHSACPLKWHTLLAHYPSNTGILSLDFSLAILILFLSPFKSALKLFQWALAIPVQKSFSSFETGMSCLLPKARCCVNTWSKTSKICWWYLAWSQVLICWLFLFLPLSFPATGRIEEDIACAPDPLTSHPKALRCLKCPQTYCIIAAYLENQSWIIIWGPHQGRKLSLHIFDPVSLWRRSLNPRSFV